MANQSQTSYGASLGMGKESQKLCPSAFLRKGGGQNGYLFNLNGCHGNIHVNTWSIYY